MQQDVLEWLAASYMNKQFVILDEKSNVAFTVHQMNSKNAKLTIVSREKVPVGIVSDSDILDKVVMKGEDSNQVLLGSVMSKHWLMLSSRGIVKEALELMRINRMKRLPIADATIGIEGVVTQRMLADAVRTSVLERTFRRYRSAIKEQYKPIVGNLGVLLQFSGILFVLPALLGAALGDSVSMTGIYPEVVALSFTGFFLMSYGKKGNQDLRDMSKASLKEILSNKIFSTELLKELIQELEKAEGAGNRNILVSNLQNLRKKDPIEEIDISTFSNEFKESSATVFRYGI